MKNHVRFLLALSPLAAVGHTLSTRADVEVECFAFDAVDEQTLAFNSYGACSEKCVDEGHSVFAVRVSGCFCLDSLPSDDKKADASKCDEPCPGYLRDICGGAPGYYTVGNIDPAWFDSSNTTNTTSSDSDSFTYSATVTSVATAVPSSSGVPSNSTSSVTSSATTPSSSASGSSASSSSTVDSSSAAAPVFESSFAVVSSFVCTVALLAALI